MRLLVTGADGFVGRHLVRAARAAGHSVVAAVGPGGAMPEAWLSPDEVAGVTALVADLRAPDTYKILADFAPDSVVHLAALSSGAAARQDPATAWSINAGGTAALFDALAQTGTPTVLLASTGEVYGRGHAEQIPENAPLLPASPYAVTKLGAECAADEVRRRTGLKVIIARPFTHTGPGQAPLFVIPALASRLREALKRDLWQIPVGDLTPVRDFLDVRDVVAAYLLLLDRGVSGEAYNIASGVGQSLADCFKRLAALLGSPAHAVTMPSLLRQSDIPVLIGDASKLRAATGWAPQYSFERTLQDLVDAQAH
ncbi:MAG: NAD-dependent epimerase/dehydratase family protein [Gemmatimonadota bacterium]